MANYASCCWVLLRDCTVNQWWFTQHLTASELASCPLLPVHFIHLTTGVAHCIAEAKFPYRLGQSIWLNSCDDAFSWSVEIIYKKINKINQSCTITWTEPPTWKLIILIILHMPHTHTHTHTQHNMPTHKHTCTWTHTYMHMHTCMCTHTHTHTHTLF